MHCIIEEFTTVVVLKEQKRIQDPIWHDFLQHLRQGTVNKGHIDMLRSLIISNKKIFKKEGRPELWSDAALVTPRHGVRVQWNEAGVRQMCRDEQRRLFVCKRERK